MKYLFYFLLGIATGVVVLCLTSCTSIKPYIINGKHKVKSIEVFKGDRITVPFDGRLISNYTLYRLLMEKERHENKE
ncbi:MAG: hypothetical protein KAU20_05560 [Nanoarchaeota archaeon]|nr:hypothetical protein [Nanoarchaeota archaeon]